MEFEIRDVYRKQRAFDEEFAAQANGCDLVVWGGGNFFEFWVEDSPTGTSISISEKILSTINTPMFFNALGVDDAQGFTKESLSRFKEFLRRLLATSQNIVTVRNDGAMETLKAYASDLPLNRVLTLPDGGFFSDYPAKQKRNSGHCIGVNLAGDMLPRRFPGGERHTFDTFLSEFAKWMMRKWGLDATLSFVFFPHIYSDLRVCASLLEILPDQLRRERVRVAAYDTGFRAAESAFGEYGKCEVILGMRFHANVVPIGHGIPTIGLCCYNQIRRLYDGLSIPEYCVDVTCPGYTSTIDAILDGIISSPWSARMSLAKIRASLNAQRDLQADHISKWLAKHNLAYAQTTQV